MITSDQGRKFIQSYEKLRLAAYDDGVGVWTIGYGHTQNVKPGDTCTEEQADQWFAEELLSFEAVIPDGLVQPEQHQFDAMVSLAYNIGAGNFKGSTLRRLFAAGDIAGAAEQFIRWNKAGNPLRELPGLTKRRNAERKIFESGVYEMHN